MKRLQEEVDTLNTEYRTLQKSKDELDAQIKALRRGSDNVTQAAAKDEELMALFEEADTDKSGKIGAEEFRQAMHRWNKTDSAAPMLLEEAQSIIANLELNTEGVDGPRRPRPPRADCAPAQHTQSVHVWRAWGRCTKH